MLFRRRFKASLWEKVRVGLWPRRSFARSFRYMGKRIMRISGSPHAIALGLSIGIYASFTPFFGFHIIIAILIAWGLSANVAAAAIGTAFSNPLTMPFIFAMTYALGRALWNGGDEGDPVSFVEFFRMLEEYNFTEIRLVFFQTLLGSLVLGAIIALVTYFVAFYATWRFRRARAVRLKMARRYALRNTLPPHHNHEQDRP